MEVVALELYELEVTAPRDDFELEVKRTTQVARSPRAASLQPARELYRRFGPHPPPPRPPPRGPLRPGQKGGTRPPHHPPGAGPQAPSLQRPGPGEAPH